MYRTEEEISEKLIIKMINRYERDHGKRFLKLQQYYENDTAILSRASISDGKINNKLANAYSGYITDMATGYFIGKPVTYSATNNDFMKEIQDLLDYTDEQEHNLEVAKQTSIKGRCFEIVYLDAKDFDKNKRPRLRVAKVQAEQMLCVYDYALSPEIRFAIRWYDYETGEKKIRKIEVYTASEIRYYTKNGSSLLLEDTVQHFFGMVPVIEFWNNEEKQGDFEKVITLIDAYDKAGSDSMNNLEYFANCYMYLVGMDETDESDIEKMRKLRVLLLKEKGEAGFLQKQSNFEETKYISERLDNDIHKFSMVPNLSDENFAGNSSGIAMLYKLLGLEQLAVKKERKFKKSLQRRLEIICRYLNFLGNNYDWRDIDIKFQRNLPVNDKENVEIVTMLQNIVSKQTALSHLKIIDNVQTELEKIEEEKAAYVDLDGVSYESTE